MYRKKQDLIVGLRKSERDSSIRRTPTKVNYQSVVLSTLREPHQAWDLFFRLPKSPRLRKSAVNRTGFLN
jgi:hypothetical protein